MADTTDMRAEETSPTPEDMTQEELMIRSDYAQVLFHNIAEFYPPGADIECRYIITVLLEPQSRDWVGIYRVGWSSVRDYICFNWSPILPSYQQGKDTENFVMFQGSKMPREDGEFYQFCYVTSKGLVRGASTPFQFRQPGMDDYVEVEDIEDDIMVVKTRTAALEDDLKVVLLAKEKLIERSRMLENEQDSLVGRLVGYEQKIGCVKKERDMLAKIVEDCKGKLDSVRASNKDLETKHSGMLNQLKQLTSERDVVAEKLTEKESEMRLLQDRIVILMKDNDMLAGDKKTLCEQKELFESHFSTSETRLVAYQREREDMKKQVATLEEMCASQREDIIRFKTESERLKTSLDRQNSTGQSSQVKIDSLMEQLRNAEDKLAAAEHCKRLVNDEMSTLDQARQKASSDLEESRSQVHKLSQRLARIETQQVHENELISDEVAKCQVMLQNESMEKERLAELLQQSNEQMREFVIGHLPEKEAAHQILQDAQKNLKKQFSRVKRNAADMQKKLEKLHQEKEEWRQMESELMQEVGDLKERLLMGQDEYKTQFVECTRMKRQLVRMQKSATTETTGSLNSSPPVPPPRREKEVQVTSSNEATETEVDDNSSQTDIEDNISEVTTKMADLTSPEIQAQLDELGHELDMRNEKKNRYKNLFYEEREKYTLLQQHYFEQLQKRDEETNRMIEDVKVQAQVDCGHLKKTISTLTLELEKRDRIIVQMESRLPPRMLPRPPLHPGKAAAGAAACNYPEELDPLRNTQQGLTPPMTPLPPPISPVVLPMAKLAAVKAIVPDHATAALLEEFFDAPEARIPEPRRNSDDSDHPECPRQSNTESDVVISLSEKTCPVCNGIMGDLSEEQMTAHVNSHYNQECPMCNKVFPQNYDEEAFRQHVESHFSEDA